MARPETIKTELAQRLREVRRELGDHPRSDLSKKLGIGQSSLANYERGDSVPDAKVLLAYREQFRINIDWLVSGKGAMFLDGGPPVPEETSTGKDAPVVRSDVFKETSKLVQDSAKAIGVTLSIDALLSETVERYNELIAAARNPSDETELRALYPWLQLRISQDLEAAKNVPGSGKRPA
ncbi:MAG: helix-turn-helix domain-containing protein [Hyphomicrobiales bacterium]